MFVWSGVPCGVVVCYAERQRAAWRRLCGGHVLTSDVVWCGGVGVVWRGGDGGVGVR